MKCRKLLVVLNEDYSADKITLDTLKTYLVNLPGLYFVHKHDNALAFLINVEHLNSIVSLIEKGPYQFICRSVTEAKEYLIVLKPADNSFKALDDKRIAGMFDS